MFNTTWPESTSVSMNNATDVLENYPENNGIETARVIHVVVRPLLIIFGTTGNVLSFLVMRSGSLKTVSTCFYMAILALADTGRPRFQNLNEKKRKERTLEEINFFFLPHCEKFYLQMSLDNLVKGVS